MCEWHKSMDHFLPNLIFLACLIHLLGVEDMFNNLLTFCKVLCLINSCYVTSGMKNFQPK